MNKTIQDIFLPIKAESGSLLKTKKKFENDFLKIVPIIKTIHCNVYIKIGFHFKNGCQCDIDNLLKSLFDAIQKSNILKDDYQIKKVEAQIISDSFVDGISIQIRTI